MDSQPHTLSETDLTVFPDDQPESATAPVSPRCLPCGLGCDLDELLTLQEQGRRRVGIARRLELVEQESEPSTTCRACPEAATCSRCDGCVAHCDCMSPVGCAADGDWPTPSPTLAFAQRDDAAGLTWRLACELDDAPHLDGLAA